MSGPPPVFPRPAATILLLRDSPSGLQVLLQRRAEGMGFMAGAFVFPGGKLDEVDFQESMLARCDLPSAAVSALLGAVSSAEALGLYVAALRELFEEAGLLLAATSDGTSVHSAASPWPALRRALHARELKFVDLLELHDLHLLVSRVRYLARWITPEIEQRRFDARFFLAAAPPDSLPSHDALESVESRWLGPSDAVRLGRSGEILLPPPTTKTLELLTPFGTAAEALRWAETRLPVTICPEFESLDGEFCILLPGDPASSQKLSVYPGPTRYVLRDGFWTPG